MRTTHVFVRLMIVLLAGLSLHAADPVTTQAELDRVKALVGAGALPRNALADAQRSYRGAQLTGTVKATLLKTEISERDIPSMLEAVSELREMARENRRRVIALVEAGAMPTQRLKEVEDEAAFADKQFELAQSRAKLTWAVVGEKGTSPTVHPQPSSPL